MTKAALVTGGAQRLGRAMALHLAETGHDVALHCNGSAAAAQETAAAIRALGRQAVVLVADLLEPEAVATLVPQAQAALGPLSVLINNASIFEHDRIGTITATSWTRAIESNLRAPVMLTQDFAAQVPAPAQCDAGEPLARALVVNMIDQRVWKPTPEFTSYTLAKMGLWAFTRTAAQGLAPRVRVNAIGPGPTLQGARQSAEHFARQRAATVLRRGADADDIVAALAYLLAARSVTGQMIAVDGGQHLAWATPDVLGVEE